MFHEHSDAQFLVRWQRLPLRTHQPTQFVIYVRQRNVGRMKRTATSKVLSATWRPLVSKILFNPFSISATPLMDSPRTVTNCASGVQNFTHAFASCRLKASVVAAITALIASSSARVPGDGACAAPTGGISLLDVVAQGAAQSSCGQTGRPRPWRITSARASGPGELRDQLIEMTKAS